MFLFQMEYVYREILYQLADCGTKMRSPRMDIILEVCNIMMITSNRDGRQFINQQMAGLVKMA